MLNKELLMASAKKKEQRKVKLTIERYESFGMGVSFGYSKDFFGSLDVVPYWGTTNDVMGALMYMYALDTTSLGAPSGVTAFAEGYTQGISNSGANGDIYAMNNATNSIRYLTFDPPRWVLGSKDTQTDLEYYVEEGTWEAQDAEQGPSNDGRNKLVDCKVPVLRRFVYIVIVDAKVRRRREYCLGREPKLQRYSIEDSSNSNDIHDPYMERRDMRSQCRKRSFNRCNTEKNGYLHYRKQYVSRGYIQSVISKEALYA